MHKPLHGVRDSALFSQLANVIGVINNTGRAGYYGHPDLLAEPMARCVDGAIRRYPMPSENEINGYQRQLGEGFINDAPSHLVTQRFGGFAATADNGYAAFVIEGHPVSPFEIGLFEAYPLPNGRFMVPQPSFKDCSHACELMMLLDAGLVSTEIGHDYVAPDLGQRRTMSELMEALQERTGLEPTLVEHEVSYESGYENGRMNAWRELGSTIDAMGPCILSKMGHVVMLDNVREAGGQIYLSIRDPFHGTSLECVESSEFFRTPMGPVEDATVRAIFLGKPDV